MKPPKITIGQLFGESIFDVEKLLKKRNKSNDDLANLGIVKELWELKLIHFITTKPKAPELHVLCDVYVDLIKALGLTNGQEMSDVYENIKLLTTSVFANRLNEVKSILKDRLLPDSSQWNIHMFNTCYNALIKLFVDDDAKAALKLINKLRKRRCKLEKAYLKDLNIHDRVTKSLEIMSYYHFATAIKIIAKSRQSKTRQVESIKNLDYYIVTSYKLCNYVQSLFLVSLIYIFCRLLSIKIRGVA